MSSAQHGDIVVANGASLPKMLYDNHAKLLQRACEKASLKTLWWQRGISQNNLSKYDPFFEKVPCNRKRGPLTTEDDRLGTSNSEILRSFEDACENFKSS